MKSDEIIAAAEAEAGKVEFFLKRWLKYAGAYIKSLSFKTQATIVVGIAIASGLMFTLISASRAPTYVTRSEAMQMLVGHDTALVGSIDAMSRRMDTMEAAQHRLDSRVKTLEKKPAPEKTTTHRRKRSPVKASSASWFNLP